MNEKINNAKNKELYVSELRYRRLFETAQDGILLIDFKTGMILDVNKFLIDLLGYSKKIFLKKHLWDVGIFKDVAASKKNFLTLQKKRYVRFEDLPLETKTGKKINVEFVANAYQVDGTTIIQCNIRDITDRKRAELLINEVKTRDEAILSSIGDAVFATDNNGKILLFNKMSEEMTGIPAKEAIGRHYNQIITFIKESDGKPSNDFIAEAIKSNKITKMANHMLLDRKDKRKIPVADSAAPINDAKGNTIGCVVVFHDVTKERQIDKTKTEFISLASHQLRTPTTAIKWYSEMLFEEEIGVLNKKQREYLEEIHHGNQRMIDLVNALLSVSQIELGTFVVQAKPVNIIMLADDVLKKLQTKINEKKLEIEAKYQMDIPLIKSDEKLIRIIFQNLLSNAVTYTPPKGKISIKIKKISAGIRIEMGDSGCGIPEGAQSKIYTKFFRANNACTINPDGAGLGLFLTKSIIEAMGGIINFKSKESEGTTFFVTIPGRGTVKKI